MHVAGTPFVDFSTMGLKQEFGGRTLLVFLTWIALIRRHLPTVVVHENVLQFPWGKLPGLLDNRYAAWPIEMDPRRLGCGVSRRRRYTVLMRLFQTSTHLRLVKYTSAFVDLLWEPIDLLHRCSSKGPAINTADGGQLERLPGSTQKAAAVRVVRLGPECRAST